MPAPPSDPRTRAAVTAAGTVAALTLGALTLRATQLDQSLFGDEVLAYNEVAHHSLGQVLGTVGHGAESSPPLFFMLAWVTAKLGDPTVWIRLPSLVLGAATVPLVYLIGRRTLGRDAGLVGAAVIAAAPFATYYGIEARPYATMAFFVAASTLALLRAVQTERWADWALYALAVAAAAYSHYTAVFVLAVEAAWGLWAARSWRPVAAANLAAALLYVPWLPSLHGSTLSTYGLLEPLTAGHVLADLVRPVAGYPYASLAAIPTVAGLVVTGLAVAGGGINRLRSRRTIGSGAVLVVATALATPVGLLLYSVIGTDLWSARSLSASAPAQALLVGALVTRLPRWGRAPAIAVVAGVLVFGTARAISARYARPPYRAAAAYLDRVAAPSDPVLMYTAALVLDQALPAQFRRPHDVVAGIPRPWPREPVGTRAFVVVDDGVLRALRTRDLRPPGWVLMGGRHYSGLVSFRVLTYRAAS